MQHATYWTLNNTSYIKTYIYTQWQRGCLITDTMHNKWMIPYDSKERQHYIAKQMQRFLSFLPQALVTIFLTSYTALTSTVEKIWRVYLETTNERYINVFGCCETTQHTGTCLYLLTYWACELMHVLYATIWHYTIC